MANMMSPRGFISADGSVSVVAGALFLLVFLVVVPLVLPMALAIDILIFAVAAIAFGLMLGQAGMLSFGQSAFFAIGAYTAGFLTKEFGTTAIPTLVAAAVTGGAGAAVVAFLTARLRDVYFILMTLAFAQIIYFVAMTWRSVTGGPSGLTGFSRPPVDLWLAQFEVATPSSFYVFAAIVLVAVFTLYYAILRSPVGLALRGVKENAERLEAVGYPVWRYRLFTFTISGAMTGVAGALYAFQWQIVPVSVASMDESAAIVFMSILGGVGHPLGPVIGAAIYTWLSDVVSTFWARWPALFGAVIILIVFFMRGGIMQGATMLAFAVSRRLHGHTRADHPVTQKHGQPPDNSEAS